MEPTKFFKTPKSTPQKQYEALRAFYVDRAPAREVARLFGYTYAAFNSLRQRFKAGELDFFSTPQRGPKGPRISPELRNKVVELRGKGLSVGEIYEVMETLEMPIGTSSIDRILAQEGFPKLARRTQLKIGITKDNTIVPESAATLEAEQLDGWSGECSVGGIFLFAPLIEHYRLPRIINKLKLPETKRITALNYLMSMLALKLVGKERLSQINDFNFDRGFGLFAGLNVLPKSTAISTYSYRLSQKQIRRLMEEFVRRQNQLRTYGSHAINLDFHTIQHYGDESMLETHYSGARSKQVKGVLTLIAQDGDSHCQLYTDTDIMRGDADDAVLQFVDFWRGIRGKFQHTLVFDSKLTSYENLAVLQQENIKFITLRRRGKNLVADANELPADAWTRVKLDVPKRKYKNPLVNDSIVNLRDYGDIRQLIVKGNGRAEPTFFITNDLKATPKDLLLTYSKRWNVENVIEEAVAFFNINALSSPILIKVHLDMILTMIADTLYYHLAQRLRGFESCDAKTLFRRFVNMPAIISVDQKTIHVKYPLRAHSPVLRSAGLDKWASPVSWLGNRKLVFSWE